MSRPPEDRLISERTIPSLKGQPAIPETAYTEAEWSAHPVTKAEAAEADRAFFSDCQDDDLGEF